jgi:orotidine-5'-phosphate decarboxylase
MGDQRQFFFPPTTNDKMPAIFDAKEGIQRKIARMAGPRCIQATIEARDMVLLLPGIRLQEGIEGPPGAAVKNYWIVICL